MELGRPAAGETLVVAAATGPVGALRGQLAKRLGLRTVGIAGGPEKTALVRDRFGFDAAVDHRAPDFAAKLSDACPRDVDIYVELTGGAVFEAVRAFLNARARVPAIGTIARANASEPAAGPDQLGGWMRDIVVKHLSVQGLIVYDHAHLRERFETEIGALVQSGEIAYLEDVARGLDAAPEAFIGLLAGRNRGKLGVEVTPSRA